MTFACWSTIWYHSVPSLRHGTGLGRLSVSSKTCRWYFEVESGCLVWLWANTNKTQEAYTQTHDIAHREYGSTQRQLPGSCGTSVSLTVSGSSALARWLRPNASLRSSMFPLPVSSCRAMHADPPPLVPGYPDRGFNRGRQTRCTLHCGP